MIVFPADDYEDPAIVKFLQRGDYIMVFTSGGHIAALEMRKIEVKKSKDKVARVVVVAHLNIGSNKLLCGVDWMLSSDYSFLVAATLTNQVVVYDITISDEDKDDFTKQSDAEGT